VSQRTGRAAGSPAAERTAAGVRAMFDRVAPRYDLVNTLVSFGQDRGWRQAAARATRLAPGEVALDVACGTGALTRALAQAQPAATVLGADFSVEMVKRAPSAGRALLSGVRGARKGEVLAYLVADALRLPFPDASLDVVTIAFGLRNLPDPDQGLREFRRVLRPDGRVLVCEFSHPTAPVFGQVYDRYLAGLLPRAARLVASDAEAYEYLARSIGAWPDQPGLARKLRRADFTKVQWRDLTGGIVALHRGTVA
jgi:demethylmenaquinone methyltransferase/2-methoxy-6-polyprenyl-1,4-benzoquinol methylase